MIRIALVLVVLIFGLAGRADAANANLSAGQTLDLSIGTSDPQPDNTADLDAFVCNCPHNMGFHIINGSRYAYPSVGSYAAMTLSDARSRAYLGANGDGIAPEAGDLFYIRTGVPPNGHYFKMRVASNDGGMLGIEYDWLGNGDASPPNSNFSFDSYDLWVNFQDGSTGGATSWSWTFGDGQSGTGSSVRHRYQTPGSYSACLTASNSGGADPTPFCTNVVVSTVPSVNVPSNGGLGLDGDALDDLAISSTGCTPIPNRLIAMPGAQTAQLSKDYRQISIADMGSAVFVDGDACVGGALLDEYRDYRSGFLIRSTGGFTYRMWIADSTAQGARFQYDLIASPQIFSSSFE